MSRSNDNNQISKSIAEDILNGINEIRGDFKSLHGDFKLLHSDFISLRNDFNTLQNEYKTLEKKLYNNQKQFQHDIQIDIKNNQNDIKIYQRKIIQKLKKNKKYKKKNNTKEEINNNSNNEDDINLQLDANNGENDEANPMTTTEEADGEMNLTNINNNSRKRSRDDTDTSESSDNNDNDSDSDSSSAICSVDRVRKAVTRNGDVMNYCGIGPHLALGNKRDKNRLHQGICKQCKQKKSTHVCSVCKDNAEKFMKDNGVSVKIPYLCHTKTGRDCFLQHLAHQHPDIISNNK